MSTATNEPAPPRRVLVTGSSRGIGAAIARRLAREGFDVAVHCRERRAEAQATVEAVQGAGRKASLLAFDVAARADAAAALAADIAAHGPYWGVVCNAGFARDSVFPAMTGEHWDSVLRAGLDGFYNVLQPCVMPMIRARRGGRIVVMTSVAGLIGNRGQVNYAAAKGGLAAAAKSLALELASRGITVNCVAPGLIETDMLQGAPVEEILKQVPAQRLGQPDEVAGLVAYLLRDEAGYVTRQVISINGGLA